MKTIGFFSNKGGLGTTSMVYHVAHILADLRMRVVAADLDPQANLTAMFLSDTKLEAMWDGPPPLPTIHGAISLLFRRGDAILDPAVEAVADGIGLVAGDLGLSAIEDDLSRAWADAGDGREDAVRLLGAFATVIQRAAAAFEADLALVDVGPSLGALNRAALLACDAVVVPVGADLFSLAVMRNMGPTLRTWRSQWADRKQRSPSSDIVLPEGAMQPLGYVVMRHSVRLHRSAREFYRWLGRLPEQYRDRVLNASAEQPARVEDDPNCLAILKDYRSLVPMAQEARKPMFHLRPADGAFGSHQQAALECWKDFNALTRRILERAEVAIPDRG